MNELNISGEGNLPAQSVNALTYNGAPIATRGEKLSLTDMWKAAGADPARQPSNWLASADAQRFSEYVAEILNPGISGNALVHTVRGGKTPGTWAHWQMAFAYAKYLSPAFHAWCNEVVRDRMEGRALAAAHGLSKADIAIIGNVVKNCSTIVIREQIAELVPQMLNQALAGMSAGAALSQIPEIRKGRTAGQIWKQHGFPRLHATSWFGNRLTEMGCAIYTAGDRVIFTDGARLFDPEKAAEWISHGGGRALIEGYVKERLGQGKLEGV